MEITKRKTTIKLTKKEQETIADASMIFTEILYEMTNCETLLGHDDAEWQEIVDGLNEVAESGEIVLE